MQKCCCCTTCFVIVIVIVVVIGVSVAQTVVGRGAEIMGIVILVLLAL